MKFETSLDRSIFRTIQGSVASNPQTLMGIIFGVDAQQRMVLTHKELSDGLQRLIDAGDIVEIESHQFCDASSTDGPKTFSGISESDYENAVQEYRDWFQQQRETLDDEPGEDDFVWQKLVLSWKTPGERWPTDEDEDSVEELARAIDPIIGQSGLGEINGFEHSTGQIDLLIFGKATDSDVDEIYELLAPAFRAFGCPAGSRIIRVYNERNERREEVESDIVLDK